MAGFYFMPLCLPNHDSHDSVLETRCVQVANKHSTAGFFKSDHICWRSSRTMRSVPLHGEESSSAGTHLRAACGTRAAFNVHCKMYANLKHMYGSKETPQWLEFDLNFEEFQRKLKFWEFLFPGSQWIQIQTIQVSSFSWIMGLTECNLGQVWCLNVTNLFWVIWQPAITSCQC